MTRQFRLIVESAAASLYFAAMFFVLIPAAILWATRAAPFVLGPPAAAITGAMIVVAANLFVLRLVGDFIRRGDGTHVPIDPPRRFLRDGVYGRIRNPMYLAYVLVALGEALLFWSGALAVYAAGLWLIAHLYVVHREEPLLAERFGDAYARYRRTVPRWGWPSR